MLIGRYDDPATYTGIDVDVRIDAALTDESKRGEAAEQWLADLRSFANQYECLGVPEAFGERVYIFDVIIPDRYVVPIQLAEAGKGAEGVEVVVENRDSHSPPISVERRPEGSAP